MGWRWGCTHRLPIRTWIFISGMPIVRRWDTGSRLEWTRRIEAATGIEPILEQDATGFRLLQKMIASYKERTPADVIATMDRFGADYFVTTPDHAGLPSFADVGFELCFDDGARRIYRRPDAARKIKTVQVDGGPR